MDKDQQKEHKRKTFIKELTKLSLKYGVTIGGCGCCGSPFLTDLQQKVPEGAHYTVKDGTLQWEGD